MRPAAPNGWQGPPGPETRMSFLLYVVSLIVFIAGFGWIATALGASQVYVLAGALILLAAGIVTATLRSRDRDLA